MELAELKKGMHAYIDEVDDEQTLLEVAHILQRQEDLSYENTEQFRTAIKKAQQSIADGEGYSHEEAMNIIKNRLWRQSNFFRRSYSIHQ